MAKVGNNIVTSRLSGKLGDLIVFRTRGASKYVSSSPKTTDREQSGGASQALPGSNHQWQKRDV